jgi:carbonic anhydrase
VARRLAAGTLQLHGMYFHVAEAQAYILDRATGVFSAVRPDAAPHAPQEPQVRTGGAGPEPYEAAAKV